MTLESDSTDPINLAGIEYMDIESIVVAEFHAEEDGQGGADPERMLGAEQVHLIINIRDFPYPIIMRFKSKAGIDKHIVDLMRASRSVWPDEDNQYIRNQSKRIERGQR